MYYVYKYIDPVTKECLYVGKTEYMYERNSSHLNNKKEDWCTKELILKYIELPSKRNMDFFEVYLINELNPRFNKLSKGDMDTKRIFFDYKDKDWNIYLEEDFTEKVKKKRTGRKRKIEIKYDVSQKSINFLNKIKKINAKSEMLYENNVLNVLYNLENRDIEFFKNESDINLISYDFEILKSFGGCTLISMYRSWTECIATNKEILIDIELKIRVGSLINLMELKPIFESEIIKIGKHFNDILKIIGIDCEWDKLSDYCNINY